MGNTTRKNLERKVRADLGIIKPDTIDLMMSTGLRMLYFPLDDVKWNAIKVDGLYYQDKKLIYINSSLELPYESEVIMHEWLHAYEHLAYFKPSTEARIDWWAWWYVKRKPEVIEHIRERNKLWFQK